MITLNELPVAPGFLEALAADAPGDKATTYSIVVLVDIDDFTVGRMARGDSWAAAARDTVRRAISEAEHTFAICATVWPLDPDEWLLLLSDPDLAPLRERSLDFAEALRAGVAASGVCTITAGVGSVHHGADRTERSLTEAVRANETKLVLGGNRILTGVGRSLTKTAAPSPPVLEGELAIRVRQGDWDGVAEAIRGWLERSSRVDGVTPELLRSWFIAAALYAMSVAQTIPGTDGMADWVQALDRASIDELLTAAPIHERSYLMLWLDRLIERVREPDRAPLPSGRRLLALVQAYLEEHYAENLSLSSVGRSVYVTPCYISHVFQRELGTTFLKYLSALRVGKARELLEETSLPISEVARRVGYATPKNFRFVFKRAIGLTPVEYRARHWSGPI